MAGPSSPKEQFITNLGFKEPGPSTRQQIDETLTGANPQRLSQFNAAYESSRAAGRLPADAAFSALASGSSGDIQGDANFAAVVNNAFKMGAHLAVVDGNPAAKDLYVAAARTEAYVTQDSRYAEADTRGNAAYAADTQNTAAVAARVKQEQKGPHGAPRVAKLQAQHGRRPTGHRTALLASTHLSSSSGDIADQLNAEVMQNGKTKNVFASNAEIDGSNRGQRELASTMAHLRDQQASLEAGGKLAHPGLGLGEVTAETLPTPTKGLQPVPGTAGAPLIAQKDSKPDPHARVVAAKGQPKSVAIAPQMGMHPHGFS